MATSANLWQTADLAKQQCTPDKRYRSAFRNLITAESGHPFIDPDLPQPGYNNNFTIVFGQAKAGNYLVQVTDARGVNVAQQRVTVGNKGQSVSGINLSRTGSEFTSSRISDKPRGLVTAIGTIKLVPKCMNPHFPGDFLKQPFPGPDSIFACPCERD